MSNADRLIEALSDTGIPTPSDASPSQALFLGIAVSELIQCLAELSSDQHEKLLDQMARETRFERARATISRDAGAEQHAQQCDARAAVFLALEHTLKLMR